MHPAHSQPESHRETWKKVALVMFGLICAVSFRSWLYVYLQSNGTHPDIAKHLTFFVELALLFLLLFPLWRDNKQYILHSLSRAKFSARMLMLGVGLGVAHRVALDGITIVQVATGLSRSSDPDTIVGPVFSFSCPPPEIVLLHLVSLSLFVPITEEVLFRSWIASWLARYGKLVAVFTSSILFMLVHDPHSMFSAWIFGIYLAVLFLNTRSLWPVIVAHAVSNALILLDWHCLNTHWNPTGQSQAVLAVGLIAGGMSFFALAIAALLVSKRIAAPERGDG